MDDTPRSAMFDDVYFSAADGAAETQHVFLDGNNLPQAWQGKTRFAIGETGFGTGLNFLLAWGLFDRTAESGAFLDFVSVEKYPLKPEEIKKALSPWSQRLSPYLDKMLAQYPMRVPGFHRIVFDRRVALTLIFDDANVALPEVEGSINAWFLDGFTPSKNPDMWTDAVFNEIARLSAPGATFATFTSAGFVKRGLQNAGFDVQKRKGFAHKRDMLAGYFKGTGNIAPESKEKEIAIAGAGLAGCAAAFILKQYGFGPVLHDPNGVASGASGNPVGIINPRLSAYRTPESDFYTSAFALAERTFKLIDGVEYDPCGTLHLVTDEEKQKRFSRTVEHWGWPSEDMAFLSPREASEIAGIDIKTPALYLPKSARINPRALCEFYANDFEVIKEKNPYAHILANGAGAADALTLPIHTVRGQITMVKANAITSNIKTALCYGGYISPASGGLHVVGATFQKWMTDTNSLPEDDLANLESLKNHIPALGGLEIMGSRAALRTASPDRFPLIGELNRALVSTAHGSHGIVSTIAAAHLLADIWRGGVRSLGKSTVKKLSPARFEDRELRKMAKKS